MKTIAHAVVLFCLLYVALHVASEQLPDPVEAVEPISCAGLENCKVGRFQVSEGRVAYCQIRWTKDRRRKAGRCIVDPPRNENAG